MTVSSPSTSRVALTAVALILAACSGDATGPGSTPPPAGTGLRDGRALEPSSRVVTSDLANGPWLAAFAAGPIDAAEARTRATRVVAGTVVQVEADTERTLPVWEAKVRTAGGALVEVYFTQQSGQVLQVEGKTGPFDYAIDPGAGFVTLEAAVTAARAARAGELRQWELELDDDMRWEYEILLLAGGVLYGVDVDARTGAIRETKVKRGDGDHDDDDDVDLGPLPDAIRQAALARVPGATLVEAEAESENGVAVWKLELRTASGAEVEIKLLPPDALLFEIEGDGPPFDYEVNPGTGLVAFTVARAAAAAAAPGLMLEEWELERGGNGNWYYWFEFDGADDVEVEVSAATGQVLRVKSD